MNSDRRGVSTNHSEGQEVRKAVLYTTHRFGAAVAGRFRRLLREAPADYEVFLALDVSSAGQAESDRARETAGDRLFAFQPSELADSPYPHPWTLPGSRDLVPGNLGLLHLHFAERQGEFDRIWALEYDVCYTGHWGTLLSSFEGSSADVLGTTLQTRRDRPDWDWWPSLRPTAEIPFEECIRGFFPVLRISRRALDVLDTAYSGGWSGHFEAVLPTAARQAGLEIEDLGGDGPFVRPENRNRHYTNSPLRQGLCPGTFVYRPARRFPGLRRNKLWHPIKPTAGRIAPYLKMAGEHVRAHLPHS